ncbi:hypothetical protein [Streptomyces colonosanans]|uniref:Uncharacterized protein n=1 Tax=Streptomyces colonosanans TaxID=1428652 RepID=A0A1S2PBK7_9ACTN|nr:hypothetical protein [Streptomyces colonosanans]OIJ91158.1 hypothetical protein BIV24_16325 [Streptomyces colonosanans]
MIVTWNEPEDQIPAGGGTLWCDPVGGDTRLKGCSDLLDDFFKKIGEMESEYLRTLDGAP